MPGVEAPAAVLQLARELSEGDAAIDNDTAYSSDKQPDIEFAGSLTCLHQLMRFTWLDLGGQCHCCLAKRSM